MPNLSILRNDIWKRVRRYRLNWGAEQSLKTIEYLRLRARRTDSAQSPLRSAPLYPMVLSAKMSRSFSGVGGFHDFVWTDRISRRASRVGRSNRSSRSKRPKNNSKFLLKLRKIYKFYITLHWQLQVSSRKLSLSKLKASLRDQQFNDCISLLRRFNIYTFTKIDATTKSRLKKKKI